MPCETAPLKPGEPVILSEPQYPLVASDQQALDRGSLEFLIHHSGIDYYRPTWDARGRHLIGRRTRPELGYIQLTSVTDRNVPRKIQPFIRGLLALCR